MVGLRTYAPKGGALTADINPAYVIMKHAGRRGEQESHKYEVVGPSSGNSVNPPPTKATGDTYEIPPSPPPRPPLPNLPLSGIPPTGEDMGVVKEGEEKVLYATIPGI